MISTATNDKVNVQIVLTLIQMSNNKFRYSQRSKCRQFEDSSVVTWTDHRWLLMANNPACGLTYPDYRWLYASVCECVWMSVCVCMCSPHIRNSATFATKNQTITLRAVLSMKIDFNRVVIDICSLGCDWWEIIICLNNGLAPHRRQGTI